MPTTPLIPFRELDSMERRARRIFDAWGLVPMLVPAADIYETPDELVVELEVPGFDEKDLDVEVIDHVLTVKGTRKETKEQDGEDVPPARAARPRVPAPLRASARGGHDEGEGRLHEGRAGAPHAEDDRGEGPQDSDRGQVTSAGTVRAGSAGARAPLVRAAAAPPSRAARP